MKVSAPHRGWTSGRATPSLRPTPMRQRQQTRQDATYRSRKSVQTTAASSLRHLDVALTYREVGRAAAALAQRLAAIVAPGEAVAVVLPNSIEFHIAYFAALRVLAAPALLNPHYPAIELSRLLRK